MNYWLMVADFDSIKNELINLYDNKTFDVGIISSLSGQPDSEKCSKLLLNFLIKKQMRYLFLFVDLTTQIITSGNTFKVTNIKLSV